MWFAPRLWRQGLLGDIVAGTIPAAQRSRDGAGEAAVTIMSLQMHWEHGGWATPSWLSPCPHLLLVSARGEKWGVSASNWDTGRVLYPTGDPRQPCCHPGWTAVSPFCPCTPFRSALAMGTSWAFACDVHKERGRGQGRAVLGEQVDVAVPWGQSRHRVGDPGLSPPPVGGHPPSRMLPSGSVNCPTKSLQEVLSWSSTTKRTNASSGTRSWNVSVSSQRGLKPTGVHQGGSLPREWGTVGAG